MILSPLHETHEYEKQEKSKIMNEFFWDTQFIQSLGIVCSIGKKITKQYDSN